MPVHMPQTQEKWIGNELSVNFGPSDLGLLVEICMHAHAVLEPTAHACILGPGQHQAFVGRV